MTTFEETVGTYKPGSLRRIKLHNFLTYSDVEFSPGPRLNMVIGPNGTGKSTILCAICLGLGGEPKLLGRADDAATFIMYEKDHAIIEIELSPFPGKEAHTIKRIIDHKHGLAENARKKGKSTFFINDEQVSAKKVVQLVSETYRISVDNLCTFLPQDRVGSFSGFNAQELLRETQKSMAGTLYETHQQLIQMEEDLRKGGANVETIQERLKKLEAENERLEREKERMEEREMAIAQAQLLEKKLVWLKFDEARKTCVELKKARDAAKEKLRAVSEKLQPLQEAHATLQADLERARSRYRANDTATAKAKKDMHQQGKKVENHTDNIEDGLSRLMSLESDQRKAVEAVENQREKLQRFENQLAGEPSEEELKQAVAHSKTELARHRPAYEQAKKKVHQLKQEFEDVQSEHTRSQKKLVGMQDEKSRRRERIYRQLPQLEKISSWLSQHRKDFRRPVHGPVVCEISTDNNEAAGCLEFHVPNYVLKMFVVECKEDYDLLYKEVRQKMNLPINIQVVDQGKLRPVQREYSEQKMQTLKKEHGVVGYLDELFTAPDAIMEAMRSAASIHKVLVGGAATQESLDRKGLLDYLAQREDGKSGLKGSCIFSIHGGKSYRYTTTISRYSGKSSLSVDDGRPARYLSAGTDNGMKARLENELAALHKKVESLGSKYQAAVGNHDAILKDHQEVTNQLKVDKEKLGEWSVLNRKVISAAKKLQVLEEKAAADNGGAKRKLVKNIMARVTASVDALEAHSDCHAKVMKSTFATAGVRVNQDALAVSERRASEALQESQAEFRETEQEAVTARNKFNDGKKVMGELKKDAEALAPLQTASGEALPLQSQLEELPVTTCEEAEAALEEALSRANAIDANPDVIRQYEQRKLEIETIREQLDDMTDLKDSKMQELDQIRTPWESSLQNATEKVGKLFAEYMGDLGCVGEVKLSKGGRESKGRGQGGSGDGSNTGNFKDWGIDIMVQFREGGKPQKLSAQVQSGGERSVSTIMYLMALQELMVSPFRCVDEINQGLDERNERLVFRRIVENSTRPPEGQDLTNHSGQYFLITPKLLPNLTDMEVEAMTVLFIFNGPYAFDTPLDWNAEEFIRHGKRPALDGIGNEMEEGGDENKSSQINSQSSGESPLKRRRVSSEE